MTVAMITGILFLLPVVVSVQLEGNCSMTRGPPEGMRVWGIQRDPLTCHLLNTDSCANGLPEEFSRSFMGSPESLSVEGILVPDPNGGLSPQIVIRWEPPRTGIGFENVKGFFMEIRRIIGFVENQPSYICRIFDFTNNQFTAADYQLNFEKKLVGFPGGAHVLYRLDMYTLPMMNVSIPKREYFTLQPVYNVNKPATSDWSAGISYGDPKLTSMATVTFRFTLAPKQFGFKQYDIMLIRPNHDDKNAFIKCRVDLINDYPCQKMYHSHPSVNATVVEHSFHDIPAGTYRVWVQAIDPFWQIDHKCLCYETITDTGKKCKRCVTTETGNIVVNQGTTPVITSEAPTLTPVITSEAPTLTEQSMASSTVTSSTLTGPLITTTKEKDDSTIVASVVGSLVGLGLIATLGFLLWRRRTGGKNICSHLKEEKNKKNNIEGERPNGLQTKSVYLIYTNDHKDHMNVVTKFANYLKIECCCTVYFIPWDSRHIQITGSFQWIITNINRADYVIIINSEAAFKMFEARNANTCITPQDQGPEGDMFSPAMTHVTTMSGQPDFFKKVILTYFEYTHEDFVLRELNLGVQYKLPKHLKDLLCHIHEVDVYGQEVDPRRAEVEVMETLQTSAVGRELVEAITKARCYQKADPEWFVKRFHRQDSAYHSDTSGDGTSQQLDSVSIARSLRDEHYPEEFKSTVTYNTDYSKSRSREEGEDMVPPSVVATTTVSTNVIEDKLDSFNSFHLSTDSGYCNPTFSHGSPTKHPCVEFIAPDMDINSCDIESEFLTINMDDTYEPYASHDRSHEGGIDV